MATPKTLNLSDIRKTHPKAFKAYLEMLVEDCQDEFTIRNGKLHVHVERDGAFDSSMDMVYNPKSTASGGPWEEVYLDEEDE